MKKFYLFICLFIGLTANVIAQEWVPFLKLQPEVSETTFVESNTNEVHFTFNVSGMYWENILKEGIEYSRFNFVKGSTDEGKIGYPQLQYVKKLIAIPDCESVSLTYTVSNSHDFNNVVVYPQPKYVEKQTNGGAYFLDEEFVEPNEIYSSSIPYPTDRVVIAEEGYMRNQKYVEIRIFPLQYIGSQQKLKAVYSFDITLSFNKPTSDNIFTNTGEFKNISATLFENTNDYDPHFWNLVDPPIFVPDGDVEWVTLQTPEDASNIIADYLIICSDPFFEPENENSEVLRMAKHKAKYNHFDVAILNAQNIVSDNVGFAYTQNAHKYPQRIRECIKKVYNGAHANHTLDGKLAYVLLIGDAIKNDSTEATCMYTSHDPNPGHSHNTPYPSDYYYSCLTLNESTGIYDRKGELFVGRFSVDNNDNGKTELHNMVEKTINFERRVDFSGWRNNITAYIGPRPVYNNAYSDFLDNIVPNYIDINKLYFYNSSPNITDSLLSYLNSGTSMMIYNVHGSKHGWVVSGQDDDSLAYLPQERLSDSLANDYKAPIVHAIACSTGEFDSGSDCFAEYLTTFSPTKGFTSYIGAGRSINYYSGTSVSFPPNNVQEYIPYAIYHHLSHITGEYFMIATNNSQDSETAPFKFNLFGDPALKVTPSHYRITQDMTLPRNLTITSYITVDSGVTVTMPNFTHLYFERAGCLDFKPTSKLVIGHNSKIYGSSPWHKIRMSGTIQKTGSSTTFFSSLHDDEYWGGGLVLSGENTYNLDKYNFKNCKLTSFTNLNLSQSIFTNSQFKTWFSDINVASSQFNNSPVFAWGSRYTEKSINIDNMSKFENAENDIAIQLNNFTNYNIENNTISNNPYGGLYIYNSGLGTQSHDIKNNIIHHNGNTQNGTGILLYHSEARLLGSEQNIHHNNNGIICQNNSNVSIEGNNQASLTSQTQRVVDNNNYQVYAAQNSFPHNFEWNAVYRTNDEHEMPLVYYNDTSNMLKTSLNVKNNYWGTYFQPLLDLYPSSDYTYLPIWNLSEGGSNLPPDKQLYAEAEQDISNGAFTLAEGKLKSIIQNYESLEWAQAAERRLFSIAHLVENNYNSLINYYESNDSIQSNPKLKAIADKLTNDCNIQLKNYSSAIEYYENIIAQPPSLEDSIFAVIDLGDLYLRIAEEDSSKSTTFIGKIPELKPKSHNAHIHIRDSLLKLSYRKNHTLDSGSNFISDVFATHGNIINISPNPLFTQEATIRFQLATTSNVKFVVYNISGQVLQVFDLGKKSIGNHEYTLNIDHLQSKGIYSCAMYIDNQLCDKSLFQFLK